MVQSKNSFKAQMILGPCYPGKRDHATRGNGTILRGEKRPRHTGIMDRATQGERPRHPGNETTHQNRPRSKARKRSKLPSDGDENPCWANDDIIMKPNILMDRLNPIQGSRLIVLLFPWVARSTKI